MLERSTILYCFNSVLTYFSTSFIIFGLTESTEEYQFQTREKSLVDTFRWSTLYIAIRHYRFHKRIHSSRRKSNFPHFYSEAKGLNFRWTTQIQGDLKIYFNLTFLRSKVLHHFFLLGLKKKDLAVLTSHNGLVRNCIFNHRIFFKHKLQFEKTDS